MANEPLIEARNLTKSYRDVVAIRDLSFAIQPGEVLGLVGPNGAGKTTTLRCLAGILPPTRGTIRVAGVDLGRDPVAAKRGLAFIADEPRLFEYLTVSEHLQFMARVYQVRDAETHAAALLDELELTSHRHQLPGELSRGMRQKLAIACGLLHQPLALLLDEPLTGLDPAGIRRMKNTITQRARAGAAVILSSHLLPLVEELCSTLLIMGHGRMLAHGTLGSILASRPDLAGGDLEDAFLAITDSGTE